MFSRKVMGRAARSAQRGDSRSQNRTRDFFKSFSVRWMGHLHYEELFPKKGDGLDGMTSILFLHGLLGSGRNLKTFAKKHCSNQEKNGLLFDQRGHGKSFGNKLLDKPHNFESCVEDVRRTLEHLESHRVKSIVGHSWGGRIGLQYAATVGGIERLWLLDTVPGQAHDSVERVVSAVKDILLSPTLVDRKEISELFIKKYGIDVPTAQWLASSYQQDEGSFGFDLEIIEAIWPDFAGQDFYGLIEAATKRGCRVDLVRGGANKAWSIEILRELDALSNETSSMFFSHVLPKAGHWVHVDDLPTLLQTMQR